MEGLILVRDDYEAKIVAQMESLILYMNIFIYFLKSLMTHHRGGKKKVIEQVGSSKGRACGDLLLP